MCVHTYTHSGCLNVLAHQCIQKARPVESDAGLVRELIAALQQQPPAAEAAASTPSAIAPAAADIHALMARAPSLSARHDLEAFPLSSWGDPAALALREKGRVGCSGGNGDKGGGGVGGGRFFSEAWAFRTVTGALFS